MDVKTSVVSIEKLTYEINKRKELVKATLAAFPGLEIDRIELK